MEPSTNQTPITSPTLPRRRAEVVILSPEREPTSLTHSHSQPSSSSSTGPRPISPPIDLPPTPPTRTTHSTSLISSLGLVPSPGYFDVLPNLSGTGPLQPFGRPNLISTLSGSDQDDSDHSIESPSEQGALFITSLQTGHRSRRRRGRPAPRALEPASSLDSSGPTPTTNAMPSFESDLSEYTEMLNELDQSLYERPVNTTAYFRETEEEADSRTNVVVSEGRPLRPFTTTLSSLRRRRLEANNEDSDWRHALVQQLHNDFDTGVDRSTAINRLRQRTLQYRAWNNEQPTDSDQPETSESRELDQPQPMHLEMQMQMEFEAQQSTTALEASSQPHTTSITDETPKDTLWVYCGSRGSKDERTEILPKGFRFISPSPDPESSSNTNTIKGCGKLISVRATTITPLSRNPSSILMLSSNVCPVPHTLGVVDSASRLEFETHPSNPFKDAREHRHVCYCTKEYIGCLSCGNIVGHWSQDACFYCRKTPGTQDQTFIYYTSRVTGLPRTRTSSTESEPEISEFIGSEEEWPRIGRSNSNVTLPSTSRTMDQRMRSSFGRRRWSTIAPSSSTNEGLVRNGAIRISHPNLNNQETNINPRADSLDIEGIPIRDNRQIESNDYSNTIDQRIRVDEESIIFHRHHLSALRRQSEEGWEDCWGSRRRREDEDEDDEELVEDECRQRVRRRRRLGEEERSHHIEIDSRRFVWSGEVCAR
ncbi:hypothetical protein CROQUDRAFT_673127 [Cronartium quercuum f. sp. fusiforme G11]|uniref:Uncharacterized protein n=1 Tax=Cronartium quercuum f. sp. fusiforme G11 TaxID=708437 RepID=A0A9P6NFF5_9BASI|nr:hypothetical protein CROQUDRAFT_674901 [Cronartium quercuum f. sp. fusiforme G11]KAG0143207.1 hypothetical protein CROQUDRAFT_673127 [Cronartium quercuum f. sp. fusiforme G11]